MGFLRSHVWVWAWLWVGSGHAAEDPAWVERLAFWAAPQLKSLKKDVAFIDAELANLPVLAGVNSGNRSGFQSAGNVDGTGLVGGGGACRRDAGGHRGPGPAARQGFQWRGCRVSGFRGALCWRDLTRSGETILLMDETSRDFPNPGLYPVSAHCPAGGRLQRIRLTVTEPWDSDGPPVLALSEIMVLQRQPEHDVEGAGPVIQFAGNPHRRGRGPTWWT